MGTFSKWNTLLKSANTLEALLKNVLLYNLMTAFARFQKYWLSFMRYSALKSTSFMFCQRVNLNFLHASCHLYLLIGNVPQKYRFIYYHFFPDSK